MNKAFETIHLCKDYGKKAVLRDCCIYAQYGKITGILGPNGSGKTTIMKLISGLITPSSGKAVFPGQPPQVRASELIAALIEEPCFYRDMSGADNLKYLLALNGQNYQPDHDAILRLGLSSNINAKTASYSFGTKARLALAYIFMQNKPILVLDEASNGLDMASSRMFHGLLKRSVTKNGSCAFISSHNIQELQDICNDIYIIYDGNIIQYIDLNSAKLSDLYEFVFSDRTRASAAYTAVSHDRSCRMQDFSLIIKLRTNNDISGVAQMVSSYGLIGIRKLKTELEEIYSECLRKCGAQIC